MGGDTRVVLGRDRKALCLTTDHKPNIVSERARIEAAGGIVIFGRTNGTLAVSRAIGDFAMKSAEKDAADQCVTAIPHIETATLTDTDDFVVLACDGVWDVVTNDQVVAFVYEGLQKLRRPEDIVAELANRCVISRDNITIILILLKSRFSFLNELYPGSCDVPTTALDPTSDAAAQRAAPSPPSPSSDLCTDAPPSPVTIPAADFVSDGSGVLCDDYDASAAEAAPAPAADSSR